MVFALFLRLWHQFRNNNLLKDQENNWNHVKQFKSNKKYGLQFWGKSICNWIYQIEELVT